MEQTHRCFTPNDEAAVYKQLQRIAVYPSLGYPLTTITRTVHGKCSLIHVYLAVQHNAFTKLLEQQLPSVSAVTKQAQRGRNSCVETQIKHKQGSVTKQTAYKMNRDENATK